MEEAAQQAPSAGKMESEAKTILAALPEDWGKVESAEVFVALLNRKSVIAPWVEAVKFWDSLADIPEDFKTSETFATISGKLAEVKQFVEKFAPDAFDQVIGWLSPDCWRSAEIDPHCHPDVVESLLALMAGFKLKDWAAQEK